MDKPAWLEVSVMVDGELAEAVAEVLSRFTPNGVVIESTQVEFPPNSDFDTDVVGVESGPLRVYGYLPVDESPQGAASLEETRHKLEESLWHLGCICPIPNPEYKLIQEIDWSEAWKKNFHPIAVGQNMMIIPAWMDVPLDGKIPIRIDPGMAFGTGTHPTTQLCMEFIEKWIGQLPQPVTAIDIGCGSGILSIAALKLGAQRALGVDTDANTVPIAYENAKLNGITEGLEFGAGSLAQIQAGVFGMRQAPLILANILAPVIVYLLDNGMADLISSGGVLILSGILEQQLEDEQPSILPALQRHGLTIREKRQVKDWVALVVSK